MQNIDLLTTLTSGLSAALVLGYVAFRLGFSPIVGYLVAGIAVGPHTPGYIANGEIASQLAELGVVLLMFGVGLHFDLHELVRVRRVAIPGALLQSTLATMLGMVVAYWFGWSWRASTIFGIAISFASTVVVTRILSDANELQTPVGSIAIGWLIVQDLIAVLILVLMPAFAGGNTLDFSSMLLLIVIALSKLAIVGVTIIFVGGRLVPKLLKSVAATQSRELFTLSILVIALGIAVSSSRFFGVSMALGAFLAGVVVGQSDFSLRAATDALPMRDAFAVLFFVSIGMLFDPNVIVQFPGMVLLTLVIVMFVTPVVSIAIILVLGFPLRMAFKIGLSLAQIGEFSFILTNLGIQLDMLPAGAINVLVAVSIVSISVSPILQRIVDPIAKQVGRLPQTSKFLTMRKPFSFQAVVDSSDRFAFVESEYRAVVVGFGPVGQTVARLLSDNGIVPTIIELNHETIAVIRNLGYSAVLGDANMQETLTRARIKGSISLILSSSAHRDAHEAIRVARALNPEIKVIVRSTYLRDRESLLQSGADNVFASEGEVALAMAEYLLRDLGASAEQIDRERQRLRSHLFE